MADTKKPDEASSELERTEEDLVAEAQELPEEDGGDSDESPEPGDAVETTTVGDARFDEVDESADETGTPEAADEDDEAPLVLDGALNDPDDRPDESGDEGQRETLDDNTVDPEDVAALEALDGAETGDKGDLDATAEAGLLPGMARDASDEMEEAGATSPPETEVRDEPEEPKVIEKETVVVERKGGVWGGFLGGAIAAVGLAFAAPFVIPANLLPFNTEDLEAQLSTQTAALATLEGEFAELRSQLSEAATTGEVSTLQSETGEALGNLAAELSDLRGQAATAESVEEALAAITAMGSVDDEMQARIRELEKRPIAEATNPAAVSALRAFEAEVAELRAEVAEQTARAEELVATTTAAAEEAVRQAVEASETAIAEAEAAEQSAAEQARLAAQAQAMVDIQAALETGEPFEALLAELEGLEVPAALSERAADGVATLPELRDGFTVAARDALAASRKAGTAEDMGGRVSSFVQTQLGLRSLAPREGDDPDAVLSRAEAAVADARLADAVDELAALPEAGQQEMADWIAQATARAEALAAADELAASLAAN